VTGKRQTEKFLQTFFKKNSNNYQKVRIFTPISSSSFLAKAQHFVLTELRYTLYGSVRRFATAPAVVAQKGIRCDTGAVPQRYSGTIATISTGQFS
jgi:hypothetical protein